LFTKGLNTLSINTPWTLEQFTPAFDKKLEQYLEQFKDFYLELYNKAVSEREKKISEKETAPGSKYSLNNYKNEYHNESLADVVMNISEKDRIIELDGRLYPQINLELTVGQSGQLTRRLAAGQLDLVYVKQDPGHDEGRTVRRERLVWVAHRSLRLDPDATVPLIVYQAPSYSRDTAIRALEEAGRTWRITCNVREVNGALAALRAGIGIGVFPRVLIPDDLIEVTGVFELPRMGEVDFTLLANPRSAREPAEALANAIHATAR